MYAPSSVIRDVDRFRLEEPLFEGLRVILRQRGEAMSTAYVCGVSGAAFRVHLPDPADPVNNRAMLPYELAILFGYEAEFVTFLPPGEDPEGTRADLGGVPEERYAWMVERTKRDLTAGRPVLAWHAASNNAYDVIVGHDDTAGTFLVVECGRDRRGYAAVPQNRPLTGSRPGTGLVFVGERVSDLKPAAAERAALEEATRHAMDSSRGLMGYDAWLGALSDSTGSLAYAGSEAPETVDRYSLRIMAGARGAGSSFLRGLAWLYGPRANRHLDLAAESVLRESEALQACVKLFPADPEAPLDRLLYPEAIGCLQRARARYTLATDELCQAIRHMGSREAPADPLRQWAPPVP